MILTKIRTNRRGFTLVEIMIVVAIIALLAAIAVPNFLRSRKRSQATRVLEDLRNIDHALEQYAMETGRAAGFAPTMEDLKNYLKTDTALYSTGTDIFGVTYGPFTVDSIPVVSDSTFNALSDVADAAFWSPYIAGASGGSPADNSPITYQQWIDLSTPIWDQLTSIYGNQNWANDPALQAQASALQV